MRAIREDTFGFLAKHGILDAKRPGGEFVRAMAAQKVYVGRV